MKSTKFLIVILLLAAMKILSSCNDFELFPDKTVYFKGRIVEAFDTNKPIDSVLVQGCTKRLSMWPSGRICDVETYTDSTGYFSLSFVAGGLEGRGINYKKNGYESLDSCKTLSDGTLECYIKPLPTIFYIYSQKRQQQLTYDSLTMKVSTETKDTTIHYFTRILPNIYGDTLYYLAARKETYSLDESFTFIKVSDNSFVRVEAIYFKDKKYEKTDFDTVFCPKGMSTSYTIKQK